MLTKKQQIQLISMTSHPKYGQLLADAIEGWKIYEPRQGRFGVSVNYLLNIYEPDYNSCCVLGAALLSCSYKEGYFDELVLKYNLSRKELDSLFQGFDNYGFYPNPNEEAYQFGNKVAKILGLVE